MAFALNINTRYINDDTGREIELPGIWTQDGVLISHLRYLASSRKQKLSPSWRERSRYAIKLLLDYIRANEGLFDKALPLLDSFVLALRMGTINVETQTDPSGLYWLPKSAEVEHTLLGHITSYTDWLAEEPAYKARRANPLVRATTDEERMNWCAYYHKKSNAFLNHLPDYENAAKANALARMVQAARRSKSHGRDAKRFPESEIHNLLTNGWVRSCADPKASPDDFIDWKGKAITILMHYGGLRKSEPFHLYLSDIIYDPELKELIVRIWHPVDGRVEFEEGYSNRRDYLNRKFRMEPRNRLGKNLALHAGWKNPLLKNGADGYIEVAFFPLTAAKLFMESYLMYLKHRVNPPLTASHPYAFTNTEGEPETVKNFNRQHIAAVERIGLQHAKRVGTSEHGHRHAYGYRLEEGEVAPTVIQKALHQKSRSSQEVYKEPNAKDMRDAFRKGERVLEEKRRKEQSDE
ncbi:MAG TPA: gamma-mobile-trio recombinase GmtY [Pseudomonas sp.]|uniref:gamma-mobile-trio recombinase GmtY n=1 Tax=Pseudomonas sp. TaxID=306 RepID=UPI002EDBADAA